MAKDFNDAPHDAEIPSSYLEDTVLDLLEDAEIDTETNDAIMKLIRIGQAKREPDYVEPRSMVFCGRCNEFEPSDNCCANSPTYAR